MCRLTGQSVAIKILSKDNMTKAELEHQMNELGILKVADSEYVVHMHDLFEDSYNIYIVMEFIRGTSLMKVVQTSLKSERENLKLMKHLISGL
jgi:serine/threonine protein kinase